MHASAHFKEVRAIFLNDWFWRKFKPLEKVHAQFCVLCVHLCMYKPKTSYNPDRRPNVNICWTFYKNRTKFGGMASKISRYMFCPHSPSKNKSCKNRVNVFEAVSSHFLRGGGISPLPQWLVSQKYAVTDKVEKQVEIILEYVENFKENLYNISLT